LALGLQLTFFFLLEIFYLEARSYFEDRNVDFTRPTPSHTQEDGILQTPL
jgi:hypothetical protein